MRTSGLRSFRYMPNSGQRAAGADGAGEGIEPAVGLRPDLRAGGAVVAHPVGDIVELVGPDRPVGLGPRQLLGQPAGLLHVVVRVLVGHGRHRAQIGAHQPQHVHLLLALRLGDHDHGAVAARVADQRQADAGIAGRALDDHAAGPQQALLLGVGDDRQRRAVLDAAAGIQELALAQDLAAGRLGDPASGAPAACCRPDRRSPCERPCCALRPMSPGKPVPKAVPPQGQAIGDAMPATDQTETLAFLEGGGLGCWLRADRHPRRDRPSGRRPRLQAQAPGPLQLPRLHHPGATRACAAPRARAQPAHRTDALSARPAGDTRARRQVGPGWRRPTGRMAAGDDAASPPRPSSTALPATDRWHRSWSTGWPRSWRTCTLPPARAPTRAGSPPCARSRAATLWT